MLAATCSTRLSPAEQGRPPAASASAAAVKSTERHLAAGHRLHHLDRDVQEILAVKPRAVPDQQLNGRLQAQQAFRPRPHRGREVIEARSKSGRPSTKSHTALSWSGCGHESGTSASWPW